MSAETLATEEHHQLTDFFRRLQATMDDCVAEQAPLSLILIYIQNLNRIYTSEGFSPAERLMRTCEQAIADHGRPVDWVGRVTEGRIAMVLPRLLNEGHAVLAANKLARIFEDAFPANGHEYRLTTSMGIVHWQGQGPEALLQQAEMALSVARKSGELYRVYDEAQFGKVAAAWDIEVELSEAIERGELELYYQPKVALAEGRPFSAEALVRWNSPKRGLVQPDTFIPVAESRESVIREMTYWALNAALREVAEWPDEWGPLSVAVNIPANIIYDDELVDVVAETLRLWKREPRDLTLEITESAVMKQPKDGLNVLDRFKAMGVKIAIDDFGTGYSSLAYFKSIPASELKIDKSFVAQICNDKADRHIVRQVIELSHGFDIRVVAEGVEDQASLQLLRELGCDFVQGYYVSEPLPQAAFIQWLRDFDPQRYGG